MTRDRVGSGDLHLTQQVLAEMLGVRRPSVTLALAILRSSGLIIYSRGRILIRDHARMEAAACECYRAVRDEFDRFLPPSR
jgi:Mn-dependent DtxR family transcriptional regulator